MPDDQHNPYAPPAEEPIRALGDASGADSGQNAYASERRPVILCIGLTLLTLGFYPAIWLIRRRRFLDRLDSSKKLGEGLPILVLVASVLSVVVSLVHDAAPIRPLSLVAGIGALIANFRVLHILRSDSARTGRFLEFSTLGTFFLCIHYLQYKINQLAERPAHVAKPRRKKKRKKAPADAELVDAPSNDDHKLD